MKNITHVISSLKMGGAENLLLTITSYLKKDNYRQAVIYFHDGPIRALIEKQGIKTYQISGYFCKYDIFFIMKIYKLLKHIKPDIILSALWAGNLFGIIIGKLLKIKVVSILHTNQEHEGIFRSSLNFLILRKANKVIAVSDGVAQSAIDKCGLTSKMISTINNGIDIKDLKNNNLLSNISRDYLKVPPDSFIFGSVGRFVTVKNYNFLIEVAAKHIGKYPNSYLLLIGGGPEYNNLKLKAQALNITNKVIFILDQPAYKYYHLFDCFIQSSLHEGLSIALLEALSFNIPCIVTNKSYHHDVIKNNLSGIICNYDQLENSIDRLYNDKKLALKIGKLGSQLVAQNFNAEIMIESYKSVFNSL